MEPPDGFLEALLGFAQSLAAGYDTLDLLSDLLLRVSDVVGAEGAGVCLIQSGKLRFVTANHDSVATVERVQERNEQGPGLDVVRTGNPVLVARMREHADRWPAYARGARAAAVAAVASIPMSASTCVGALDLYHFSEHDWTPDEVSTASIFGDIAGAHLLCAAELERTQRTVEQLEHALDSRVLIEQAKGILAGERDISLDQAFQVMRKHANDHNATLRAVADAVTNLGLRP
jgi:GAF domain-containing protein